MFREYAIGMFSPSWYGSSITRVAYLQVVDIEVEEPEKSDMGDYDDARREILMNVTTFGALCLAHCRQDIGMTYHAKKALIEGVEKPYQT